MKYLAAEGEAADVVAAVDSEGVEVVLVVVVAVEWHDPLPQRVVLLR